MQKIILLIVLVFIGIAMVACSGSPNTAESIDDGTGTYRTITPEAAKELLDKGNNLVLLDVRTQAEYDEKHIPGTTLITLDNLQKEAQDKLKDKNTTILVYCRSGNRSRTASNILLELGYKNVFDLGGIINWPFEVEIGK